MYLVVLNILFSLPPTVSPQIVLAAKRWYEVSPKWINTQYIIAGNAKNVIARFDPIIEDITPKINVPAIAPKDDNDASQPSSSFVIGPVTSGVLSEKRIGRAGESQPTMQPCDSTIKLAVIEWYVIIIIH